jgi:ubiquinone/menaquinone biosynthesis C-methylase UbiE
MNQEGTKEDVRRFWDTAACGEQAYALGSDDRTRLAAQAETRYSLEPYILDFARFTEGAGKSILEIGVGMGADHEMWARAKPSRLCGIDLTQRAINLTSKRFELTGLSSELQQADAEALPFPDLTFDIVYSWGVLHHSPDTQKAFNEAYRVLARDGVARIMIYHKWSLTGLMLWLRYGLPQRLSLSETLSRYLESPGTKAYTVHEAVSLCKRAGFDSIKTKIKLCHSDLLDSKAGQRHQGTLITIARRVWPRSLFQRYTPKLGLYLMIEGHRSGSRWADPTYSPDQRPWHWRKIKPPPSWTEAIGRDTRGAHDVQFGTRK